jgi:hypothetical protein
MIPFVKQQLIIKYKNKPDKKTINPSVKNFNHGVSRSIIAIIHDIAQSHVKLRTTLCNFVVY